MRLDSCDKLVELLKRLAIAGPKMLKKGEPEFDHTLLSFWLGKELAAELLSALNEVRLELVPKHAEDIFLANAFWDDLVCEVAANPQRYLEEPEALFAITDQFGDSWKKPLSQFKVVYAIDYLAIGPEPITLHGVEFLAPTDEALANKAIPKPEVAKWSKEEGTLTLAIVQVEAASSTNAFEAGRSVVVEALTLMRASALYGLSPRTLTDELLQWRLAGHYLVRPLADGQRPKWLLGFHRPFGPLVTELGKYLRQGMEGLRLDLLSDLPEDIRDRLLRAIYWIAHSATHETADHKFVDLCTALEILLLPEERLVSNKGAVIALRYSLLGGSLNPPAVKWMYDRRNDVIHGKPLPVVGPRDTWDLRLVCYTTVSLIAHASAAMPDVLSLQDLIGTVETDEKLTTFVQRAERGVYEGSLLPNLVKEARSKLKKLRRADA